jgi:hypothetical protein
MSTPPNPKVPRIPELVAATSAPFYLGAGAQISLAIQKPTGPARAGTTDIDEHLLPRRVFLNIENITSREWSPVYDVYLNVPPNEPPGEHPELYAGPLPMFGLVEASREAERHSGNGLYEQLDITGLFARLALLPGWDPQSLRVAFVPRKPGGSPTVQVGRVSLYLS